MAGILDLFGVHTITIHQVVQTPYGPKPGPGIEVPGCWVIEETRLVRDRSGNQVVSTAQVAAPLDTVVDVDEEPIVRLPSGRKAKVISVSRGEAPGLPLPEHLQINLE